jgi:hypothetical protein
MEENSMKKLGYVIAALGAIAIAAPSIASAETLVVKHGDRDHMRPRAEFREHREHFRARAEFREHRERGWRDHGWRHHRDKVVIMKHRRES